MTEEHIKEQMSRAFVRAVAAHGGYILKEYDIDYGIDGTFSDVDIDVDDSGHCRYYENGFGIDFQLKATTNIISNNEYVSYDLEAKNYNDLIKNKCW